MKSIAAYKIGVIIPVYNEAAGLLSNFKAIDASLSAQGIAAHYMLVDDGSKDQTWQVIEQLKEQYKTLSAIRFAKNFGKETALIAGVDQLDADIYITMDSDLQHPPAEVGKMIELLLAESADIVSGVKADRGKESPLHRFVAKTYYRLLNAMTHLDMQNSSDFKVFNAKVADALRSFDERRVFFRGLIDWVGFKHIIHDFSVEDRSSGTSRFSTLQLTKLALNAIISYTSQPLYIVVFSGVIFAVFALILGLQTLYNYFSGHALNGFSTVILVLLIIGAMTLCSLGVIGVYISRIYEEIKARPRYIIRKKL